MIEAITLHNLMPRVFEGALPEGGPSEVWGIPNLQFVRGRSYLIEAESGRGKSSLCAFLYGLRDDFAGQIEMGDREIRRWDKDLLRTRHLAMMFQEHRLFAELTAFENVMIKNDLTHHHTAGEVREMLCRLGLQDRLDTPCGRLSLGQQQRVAFVRTLCQPSDFLLLDEPVSHLDETNAEIMAEMLRELQKQTGAGILATSIGHRLPYDYDAFLHL